MYYFQHNTCLLRSLYAGQEATVRTWHKLTGSKLGNVEDVEDVKVILSRWLFNVYAEHFMRNTRMGEAQAEIRIAWRNINNFRHADDTTLIAESKEELKSLLMKVKEESKEAGLKLSIQKTKIMASCPITSWQIDRK